VAKHKSHKGGPFKSWKEAGEAMDEIMDSLADDLSIKSEDRSGFILGISLARFRFRLELTIDEMRREKRRR